MFCPKCGSNQVGRRFCTVCGTNLAAVSQALQGQPPTSTQSLPVPALPYDVGRQQEYANGVKWLLIGGTVLAYNLFKFISSFGQARVGFWGFLGLVAFAYGLSKVLTWKQPGGALPLATNLTSTPHTAQLSHPSPFFTAAPSSQLTAEIEAARSTGVATASLKAPASVTENDTLHLPAQKSDLKVG